MSTIVVSTRAWRALKAFALIISIVAGISLGFGVKHYVDAGKYRNAYLSTSEIVDRLTHELEQTEQQKRELERKIQQRRVALLSRSSDAECLARNIYFEAGGEGYEGMKAVANVVINRVRHPQFPKTVCGVVYQGVKPDSRFCQFSWACDGVDKTINFSSRAWKDSMHLAVQVLAGAKQDNTNGALYFHNATVRPRWATADRFTVQIGGHYFYR